MRSVLPLAALLSCILAAADPARTPLVEPGEVLWRGKPDALHRAPGMRVFELSPDGKSFLYLQGAPWPRVMLQTLERRAGGGRAEPVALGGVAFHGTRSPRFDLDGRRVYFTGDYSSSTASRAAPLVAARLPAALPSMTGPPRLVAVRASVDGLPAERLFPAPGARPEDFAVFLDIHPGGGTILVGSGSSVEPHQVNSGDFSLALSEVTFRADGSPIVPPRSLSFQVSGQAPIRYSWDGTAIYYGQGPAQQNPAEVIRYTRSNGSHEPLPFDQQRMGSLGGDVEVFVQPVRHPGAIGWDGFPLHLLARTPDGPAVPLRMAEALLTPLPLSPVSARGQRILLAGGLEDRLEVAVALWDPAAFEEALARSARAPHPLAADRASLRPAFSDEIRAEASDRRAADLLRRVRSSLVLLPGEPLRSVRARWIQRGLQAGAENERQVEAVELVSGELWIERTLAARGEGQPPIREVIVYDGKDAWFTGEGGTNVPLSGKSIAAESSIASPLGLLVDPLGVGLDGLTFASAAEKVERRPEGRERRMAKLEARALDGYRAEVWIELGEEKAGGELPPGGQPALPERALPARIESPFLFPQRKVVTFEGYRPAGGRLVPGRIHLQDGLNPFELVLEEVEFNSSRAETLFKTLKK